MADNGFMLTLWSKLMDMLFTSKAISVPTDFHSQCIKVKEVLDNDTTGVISTVLDCAVDSAYEANYRIEVEKDTSLESFLNKWLKNINRSTQGKIPTGIKALAKEYYKEIWQGSSLAVLRVKEWEEESFDGNSLLVPKIMYFANGSSVYIESKNEKNFNLGSYQYYLDSDKKIPLHNSKTENVVISKPMARWHEKYPVPFIIRKGIYKNYKAIELLQDKGDEVVTKILPYLFVLKKGTEAMFLQNKADYNDDDMKKLQENMEGAMKNYKSEKNKVPMFTTPFDTELEHLIPDLRNIMTEELYRQGYRAMLSGLGLIDIIQGISSTRKESVLNPYPFIAEINSRIVDFNALILAVVDLIIEKNSNHPKFFGDNEIKVVNSPIRINVERLSELFRSAYDRGVLSIQSWQEILGVEHQVEKERREKEAKDGLDDIFYPHLINNREDVPDGSNVIPAKPKNNQQLKNEDQNKKKGSPEANNFKNATIEEVEEAIYKTLDELPKAVKTLSEELQKLWMRIFNDVYKRYKDEERAFRISWTIVNKQKRKTAKLDKEEDLNKTVDDLLKVQKIELSKKQEKLLDLFLKENKELLEKKDEAI